MMAELFIKNGVPRGKEQGNMAHEMFIITDEVQYQTRNHHAVLGNRYCTCGQANSGACDEVKNQVSKHVINCFEILALSAFVF